MAEKKGKKAIPREIGVGCEVKTSQDASSNAERENEETHAAAACDASGGVLRVAGVPAGYV
jgi:hypothetical protein